jgi:soluble P-type ATPase
MTLHVPIPGGADLRLEHLVINARGTLTDRGEPITAARVPLEHLRQHLLIHFLSADSLKTPGTLGAIYLSTTAGVDKQKYLQRLGATHCVAIGNSRDDAPMLKLAALGIAVIGPEGAHHDAITAADIVALSIDEALQLLIDPQTPHGNQPTMTNSRTRPPAQ